MQRNLILFLMLLSLASILVSGCSTNPKKTKTFPVSIVKKLLIGLD
jgi:hypothetical protein